MKISNDTVSHIIELAHHREHANAQYMKKYFPSGCIVFGSDQFESSPEFLKYRECDRALEDYIRNLDYEEILDLEALMFLGRGDTTTFKLSRDYVSETYSDNSQAGLAVDYISSKGPLAAYLKKGLELL